MKNYKGITLIALIITIIVMLILAAVTINLVVGEDGVITRAEAAKLEQEKAIAIDEVSLAWSNLKLKEIEYKQQNILFFDEYLFENKKMINDNLSSGEVIDIAYEKNEKTTITYVSKSNNEFLIQIGKDGKAKVINGWIQNKEEVKKDGKILKVGDKITNYEAKGISDWYILGAEHGRLLLTTNTNQGDGISLKDYTYQPFWNTGDDKDIVPIKEFMKKIESKVKELDDKINEDGYTNVTYAEKSRSIKVSDFDRIENYDPNQKNDEEIPNNYGKVIQFSNHDYKLYYKIGDSEKEEVVGTYNDIWLIKNGETIKVIDNTYKYALYESFTFSEKIKDILLNRNGGTVPRDYNYWLNTPMIEFKKTGESHLILFNIGLANIRNNGNPEGGSDVYTIASSSASFNNMIVQSASFKIRPVVVLKPEVQVSADGTLTMPTN